MGLYGRWFAGGVVNTCYNALDRHVAGGRANQVALIDDLPLSKHSRVTKFTYAELLARGANARRGDAGFRRGEGRPRHSLYADGAAGDGGDAGLRADRRNSFGGVRGFAAKELATRIEDAEPKLILSASCGLEPGRIVKYKPLLDEAIALSSVKPQACIILQRPQQNLRSHHGPRSRLERVARRRDQGEEIRRLACPCWRPIRSIFSTRPARPANPKGVVRDNGGHLVAPKWSMFNLYGIKPGEVFWCGSDIGWVVGHSYIIYAPLFHGATSIMYEGKPIGTPDAGAFWRVISQHGAVSLFTAPTAFRAIKKEDPNGEFIRKYDLSKFRTLFLAGERADPPTVEWAEQQLKVPVIDHWWQTETGWCIAGNPVGLGHAAGEAWFADGADARLSGRRCR